jgi:hypothetical protein
LFSLDRCLVYTSTNYRHSVDRTVKSVWFRQVFGLLRVQFRQVFGLFRVQFRQVFGLLRVQLRQVFGLLRVQFRQVSLYITQQGSLFFFGLCKVKIFVILTFVRFNFH